MKLVLRIAAGLGVLAALAYAPFWVILNRVGAEAEGNRLAYAIHTAFDDAANPEVPQSDADPNRYGPCLQTASSSEKPEGACAGFQRRMAAGRCSNVVFTVRDSGDLWTQHIQTVWVASDVALSSSGKTSMLRDLSELWPTGSVSVTDCEGYSVYILDRKSAADGP